MPQIKLTSAFVENATSPQGRSSTVYFDRHLPSFGLRVTANNCKTWLIIARIHGRQRKIKIGRYPALGLSEARDAAKELFHKIAKGIDPVAERRQHCQEPTVKELAEHFIGKHLITLRRGKEAKRLIEKELYPKLSHIRARDVTRRDINMLLENIVERPAPYQANRVRAVISSMYNWGIDKELVPSNPCIGIRKLGKEVQRDRVLTHDELRKLLVACGGIDKTIGNALKFMLLTAQRKSEVLHMRWDHIANGWWTIPAEISKNGKSHRVPLSSWAQQLLSEQKNDTEWIFPSPRLSAKPINNIQKAFEVLRRDIGVDGIRMHDLRRTAASCMTSMGISRLVVEKILNHSDNSVTAIYDRHSCCSESIQLYSRENKQLEIMARPKRFELLTF